jgi:membrane protease YdiL (CAAX protease family)
MGRAAIAYALMTAVCLVLLGRLETPFATYHAATHGQILLGVDLELGLKLGFGVGIALSVLSELLTRFTRWGRMVLRVLKRVVGDLHPLDALLLAALSALGEEFLFRGLALPYFGLVASSLIFGIVHLIPRKGLWVWAVWATGAGFALGGLALHTGGLLASVCAHFTINAVGLLTLPRRKVPEPAA